MNMYYADNRTAVEAKLEENETLASKIKTGLSAYMKNTSAIADTATAGKYSITTVNGEWWLTYTLPLANTRVAKILENKASELGLKKEVTKSSTNEGVTTYTASDAYKADGVTVCMQVR